jgi:hypothetical protein
MEIPPEAIAARNTIEDLLLPTGLVTGIDFGVRDEEQPDPEDLALRIFVADASNIPPEVQTAVQFFPFPVVIIQRTFTITQLPDNDRYRPVLGGVSVASSRFLAGGTVHAGTLGAIVADSLDPAIRYGLSNYHVLCVDDQRQSGDEIVQPVPSPLGVLPGDRVGTLYDWSFPETTQEGLVDAAICTLEINALNEVADIGAVSGTSPAKQGMMVTKRGRTTGQTFGWISGIGGSYPLDYPQLPPVTTSTGVITTLRIFKNQIQIHADFPLSIVFGDHGDSGSVVLGPGNRVVGLYWGSGYTAPGDPLTFGLACPAGLVETALGITF